MNKFLILLILVLTSCTTTKHYIQTPSSSQTGKSTLQQAQSQTPQQPLNATTSSTAVPSVTVGQGTILQPAAQPPVSLVPPIKKTLEKQSGFSFFGSSKSTTVSNNPKSDIKYPVLSQKIGVILPLTGKNAPVGQRMLATIRLGLGLLDPNPQFSISLMDSQGNPDLAKTAVDKLIQEDHVIAILGGLGAKEAQVISKQTDFYEVPFFAFSQKSNLTDESEFTYRNAVTPEMQMSQLADFAIFKRSLKKFAILYPNDFYGVEFSNQFWDQVLARGGQIVAVQSYDPKETDLNAPIQKLLHTFYVDDRKEEYLSKLKELKLKKSKLTAENKNKNKKNSREKETEENLLSPIVDFDALFIPDSSRALGQSIAFLKSNDVFQMTFLGTNLWNTPDLVRKSGAHGKTIYFVDAESNTSDNSNTEFYKRYFSLHQEAPTLLEAQGYEAALLLRQLIQSGNDSRGSLAEALLELGRKPGAFGEIYMNNNRELVRQLSVLSPTGEDLKK